MGTLVERHPAAVAACRLLPVPNERRRQGSHLDLVVPAQLAQLGPQRVQRGHALPPVVVLGVLHVPAALWSSGHTPGRQRLGSSRARHGGLGFRCRWFEQAARAATGSLAPRPREHKLTSALPWYSAPVLTQAYFWQSMNNRHVSGGLTGASRRCICGVKAACAWVEGRSPVAVWLAAECCCEECLLPGCGQARQGEQGQIAFTSAGGATGARLAPHTDLGLQGLI